MFNVVNWAAVAYAKMYAAEMVGRKWTGGRLVDNPDPRWAIAASTRELLKLAVVDGLRGVSSPMQVAKAMQESAGFSKHAARLIAHTEAASAALHTLEASALSHGATHKRTSLSADHDHDDACNAAAAMGEVPIDFTYPGGMRIPLFHPGCRCSISFYVRKRR